jgi:hypothetical protein
MAVGVAAVVYVRWFRPWQLTWGATVEEVARRLPGDELVSRPTFDATRAITIAAPAEQVWPWLVQVGVTRAGWYSYDFLDNFMRPSADRIIPELQHLAPGDIMGMSPDGKQGIAVHSLDPPHSMVWATLPDTTWAWQLSPSIAFSMLLEFADIWMMCKMLLNLRDRAEDEHRSDRNGDP